MISLRRFLVVLVLSAACSNSFEPAASEPTPADVLTAPFQLTFGGTTVALSASAWRDMMPGNGLDRRLVVILTLSTSSKAPWPTSRTTGRAWIIHGAESWVTTPVQEEQTTLPTGFSVTARGGPLWPVGDSMDVVLELKDAQGGIQRLRAPRQVIGGPV
jgi:hypothetical protein